MEKRIQTVKSVFDKALEIESDAKREIYLNEVAETAPELRSKVDELLRAYNQAGDFLEQPHSAVAAVSNQDVDPIEEIGSTIGPYKLMEQLGDGGMGVVYVAEQEEPVRRKVALKIIKPGMDTKQVIARFEAERQALALMDHPNIARVFDGGATDNGRPYFVMELARGVPITEYCDKAKLGIHDRLQLFIKVCRAVQHAHQKGIIHRDLKPSNVMITVMDEGPVPKVIDFGVAKATNQRLTEKTLYTRYAQMIGTPMYMSPEQAELTGLDIDTRSDVYSLGALLYELLSGSTPFDQQTLRSAAYDEMRRIIREEEPPCPSTRLSTLHAEELTAVSDQRECDREKLIRAVRGDLDWIVMKALEKERTRRYETASAFAADIERYLGDEPVHACPPSAAYRLRKLARRNKVVLTTTLLVAASLFAGTGISVWQAVEANNARHLADDRLELANANATKAQNAAKNAERQRLRAEENVQLALQAMDEIYLHVAEEELPNKEDFNEQDQKFLEQVLPFYEKLAAQKTDNPRMRVAKGKAYLRVGHIYERLRNLQPEKSEKAFRQALAIFEKLASEWPDDTEYEMYVAESHLGFSTLLHAIRRYEEAEQASRCCIAIYENHEYDLLWKQKSNLARAYYNLGKTLSRLRSADNDREQAFRRSLALAEELISGFEDDPEKNSYIAEILSGLGKTLRDRQRPQESLDCYRQAIAILEKHCHVDSGGYRWLLLGNTYRSLATPLVDLDRFHEAERSYQRGLDALDEAVKRSSQRPSYRHNLSLTWKALATLWLKMERFEEAEKAYRTALQIQEILVKEDSDRLIFRENLRNTQTKLIQLLKRRGRTPEADKILQQLGAEEPKVKVLD